MTLEELRREARLSRFQLAEAARVNPATVWRLERERAVPTLDTCRRIGQALEQDWRAIDWPQQVRRGNAS